MRYVRITPGDAKHLQSRVFFPPVVTLLYCGLREVRSFQPLIGQDVLLSLSLSLSLSLLIGQHNLECLNWAILRTYTIPDNRCTRDV